MDPDNELDVEVLAAPPLTAFQQPEARKRGRPESLDDRWLWGTRSSLLDALDRHWAWIGCELGRAKNVKQLRAAFAPVQDSSGRLQFFVRPSILEGTPQTARVTQKKVARLSEQIRLSYDHERELRDKLDRVKIALQQITEESQKTELEALYRQREQKLASIMADSEKLQSEERRVREQLLDQKAYISQTELLSFIRSGRYSFNPVNLANAMAGLPEMGWRQSVKRCLKLKEKPSFGFGYRSFQLLVRVIKKSSKVDLVSALETELKKQPKSNYAAEEMKRNWYYLRRTIEDVRREKMHPGALPYRILAEYRRRVNSPSAVDRVLEQEQQLV